MTARGFRKDQDGTALADMGVLSACGRTGLPVTHTTSHYVRVSLYALRYALGGLVSASCTLGASEFHNSDMSAQDCAVRMARLDTQRFGEPACAAAAGCRNSCSRVCVGAYPWAKQNRSLLRRQPNSGATDCPLVQSVAPHFTPPSRARAGRKRRPCIGLPHLASRSGWQNIGWPGAQCPTAGSSRSSASSNEIRRGAFNALFRCGESEPSVTPACRRAGPYHQPGRSARPTTRPESAVAGGPRSGGRHG